MKGAFVFGVILFLCGAVSTCAPVAREVPTEMKQVIPVIPNEVKQPGTQPMQVPTLIPAIQDVPGPYEDKALNRACSNCHVSGQELTSECAACHQPPSEPHFGEACEECHTTTGFAGATIPPELHPVPLIGAHVRATCNICHDGETPEYVCSNCHRPPDDHLEGTCDTCHTPEGCQPTASGSQGATASGASIAPDQIAYPDTPPAPAGEEKLRGEGHRQSRGPMPLLSRRDREERPPRRDCVRNL